MNPGVAEVLGPHVANPPDPAGGTVFVPTAVCPTCHHLALPTMATQECPACKEATMFLHEWPMSMFEDRLIGRFEQEVRRRARAAYIDAERDDPAEGQRMRDAYSAAFTSGAYNYNDEGANPNNFVRLARTQSWGIFYIVLLCLQRCDPKVTSEVAKAIWNANPRDTLQAYFHCLGIHPEAVVPNGQSPLAQSVFGSGEESKRQPTSRPASNSSAPADTPSYAASETKNPTTPPPTEKTFD